MKQYQYLNSRKRQKKLSNQGRWIKLTWADDMMEPLPPGWQEAVDLFADRIKESIDEEVLNQVIEELKK